MPYLQKSKVKIQDTPGGELIYKLTKKDYIGSFIETSDGKFYAGGDLLDLSTELELPLVSKVKFGASKDVVRYKKIKPHPHKTLAVTNPVIGTKIKPTEEDYNKGHFIRYFAKKHNVDNDYIEINDETFVRLSRKDPIYDFRLYKVGFIQWQLKGNVHKINSLKMKELERDFPFLYVLFPIVNEYQKVGRRIVRPQSKRFDYQYPGSSGGGGGGY